MFIEKIKTKDLTGSALKWAVAKAEGLIIHEVFDGHIIVLHDNLTEYFEPFTNWAHGGPIIEREKITLTCMGDIWVATRFNQEFHQSDSTAGPTVLIAAMRCHVASKLGDEIDIPDVQEWIRKS
jgi:hypothetical protein